MPKIIPLLIITCYISGQLTAQQVGAASAWKFHSLNQIGLLQGEGKAAFNIQSVNGFEHRHFFAGLGTGLDYYRFRSIPLFAEAIQYFGKTNNWFFIYADAGVNFAWQQKSEVTYYTEKYTPGFYGKAGIGYRAGLKNGMGFLLNAGYSYKRINNRQEYQSFCRQDGSACTIIANRYTYDLSRLLIQIGWMF